MKTYILPDFTDFRTAFDLNLAKLYRARFYLVKLWFRFSYRPVLGALPFRVLGGRWGFLIFLVQFCCN